MKRFVLIFMCVPALALSLELEGTFTASGFSFNPPVNEQCFLEWRYRLAGPVVRVDSFPPGLGSLETVPLLPEFFADRWVEEKIYPAGFYMTGMDFHEEWREERVIPAHWEAYMTEGLSGFVRLVVGDEPPAIENKYMDLLGYASSAVSVSIWGCRFLALVVGLTLFRFITLRSPV